MSYTYYLLRLTDGSEVTVPELPDFDSLEPMAGDDQGEGADVDAKTVMFIPRHVVSYKVK